MDEWNIKREGENGMTERRAENYLDLQNGYLIFHPRSFPPVVENSLIRGLRQRKILNYLRLRINFTPPLFLGPRSFR